MYEMISTIALLCQFNLSAGGARAGFVEYVYKKTSFHVRQKQLECQKYYIKCVENKTLDKCVLEKKEE